MAPFIQTSPSTSSRSSTPYPESISECASELDGNDAEPIAIIGFAFKFPQEADTVDGFWKMMLEKRCAMTDFPEDRMSFKGHYRQEKKNNTLLLKGGHFIKEDMVAFDANFFSISPVEAAALDLMQRWLLEVSYHVFENAGLPIETVANTATSVHTGSFAHDYMIQTSRDVEQFPTYAGYGFGAAMLANRISWFYNLTGPSIAVDSACSSSAMVLDMACQSLKTGSSTMGLVAGCNLTFSPETFAWLSNMNMLLPDSKSYSFDHRANGYARGEGIAVMVVKRLEDAIRDGNTIRDTDHLRIRIPTDATPWPSPGLRRASVNSFGYGGANCHIVLDNAYNYSQLRGVKGKHKTVASPAAIDEPKWSCSAVESPPGKTTSADTHRTPKLLVQSASDEAGIQRLATSYEEYFIKKFQDGDLPQNILDDVAYTLDSHWSVLTYRSSSAFEIVVADERVKTAAPFPASQVVEAFKRVGSTNGPVVIKFDVNDEVELTSDTQATTKLDAGASYVICGGTGGIGRGIARWCAAQGARYLILLSRSGAKGREAQELLEELATQGVHVEAPPCDVADEKALRVVLDDCAIRMPSIKGCIQASGAFKDVSFEKMSLDDWNVAIKSKVTMSWNLHKALPAGMGFFVMTSSMSGVLGMISQSSYACANVYQNALAYHRIAFGEKAAALDLGVLKDVGFLPKLRKSGLIEWATSCSIMKRKFMPYSIYSAIQRMPC